MYGNATGVIILKWCLECLMRLTLSQPLEGPMYGLAEAIVQS